MKPDSYFLRNNVLQKSHKGFDLIVVSDGMQLNAIKKVPHKWHFGRKRY